MSIDAVFTWVDGNDPEFQATREAHREFQPPPPLEKWRSASKYTGENELRENPVPASHVDGRFRDMQELKYALRSIDTFAPWLDKIHIVTNGQVPAWLNTDHPRIRMVDHAQIFPDAGHLPCFNSNAIELHLANIPDLSEEFVYFNDDFFLGRPVGPGDFRDPDGTYRMFIEPDRPLPMHMTDRALMGHMWAYNHQLLNATVGKKHGRRMFGHCPQMYHRRLIDKMKATWPEECALTARHKFRTPFDVAFRVLYTYLFEATLLAPARLSPLAPEDYVFVKIGDDRTPYLEDLLQVMETRPRFFCLNDEIDTGTPELDEGLKAAMRRFLDFYFPTPSPFERSGEAPALPAAGDAPAPAPGAKALYLQALIRGAEPLEGIERRAGSAPWHALAPQDEIPLGSGDTLRLPDTLKPGLVHARIRVDQGKGQPQRGFLPERHLHVPLDATPGQEIALDDLAATCRETLARADEITALVTPVLDQPSHHGMAHFLAADRNIRAETVSQADLMRLDRALLGGVDPFWVCHRRALAHLQQGNREALAEDVTVALEQEKPDVSVFAGLIRELVDAGRHEDALTIAGAMFAHPAGQADGSYYQSLCRHQLSLDDPDVHMLLMHDTLQGRNIDLWSKIVLDGGHDLRRALEEVNALIAETTETVELLAARFRLLSRTGAHLHALVDLKTLLSRVDPPDPLIAMAHTESRNGNPEGALTILNGLRTTFPWLEEAKVPWAHAMRRAGHDSAEIAAILADHDLKLGEDTFWAEYHTIRAQFARGDTETALENFAVLARHSEGHLSDLLHIANELRGEGRGDAAYSIVQTLHALHPGAANVAINWADQSIGRGTCDDEVGTALDGALAQTRGEERFWAAYHKARYHALRREPDALRQVVGAALSGNDSFSVFNSLAMDFHHKGLHDEAFAIFDSLHDAAPDYDPALVIWADMAISRGMTQPAIEAALDRAIARDMAPFWAYYHKLRLYLAQGEPGRARDTCRAALALEQDMAPFRQVIADHPGLGEQDRAALTGACAAS